MGWKCAGCGAKYLDSCVCPVKDSDFDDVRHERRKVVEEIREKLYRFRSEYLIYEFSQTELDEILTEVEGK